MTANIVPGGAPSSNAPLAESVTEFYSLLFGNAPAGGEACMGKKTAPGGPVNRAFWRSDDDPATTNSWRTQIAAGAADMYHSMGVFDRSLMDGAERAKGHGRRAENLVWVAPALWADVDVKAPDGSHADGLEDEHAAVGALKAFLSATGLRPNLVVKSGSGGFHLYWLLDGSWDTVEQWSGRAHALVALCAKHGFKIDAQCTVEPGRYMRAAGSVHGKTGKTVVVKHLRRERYPLDELDRLLQYDPAAPLPRPRGGLIGEDGRQLQATPAMREVAQQINADAANWPPASALKIAQHCAALHEIAACKGDVPEPQWRAMLGLVRHTVEGLDIAQEWSSGHPDYDQAEVERKFEAWGAGPTTCNEFGKRSSACATCPHAGTLRSPILLGHVNTAEAEAQQVAGETAADAVAALARPRTPQEWQRVPLTMPDWRHAHKDGELVKVAPLMTAPNIQALAGACGWNLRHNAMLRRTELVRSGVRTAREDDANTALALFGDDAVRAGLRRDGLPELVDAAATANAYHPAADWIRTKPWDGIGRLPEFFISLELADPSPSRIKLRNALMRAWLLQGIGALFDPAGIAAQGMLTLIGPQRCRKTSWVFSLCNVPGAVATVRGLDPTSRDSIMAATACWIGELGELDGVTRRADVAHLKAFLTAHEDVMRVAYARRENAFVRRTIYAGTANTRALLTDDTGARRFWCLEVARCRPLVPEFAQQVWAEAFALYQHGERWHLDDATYDALNASNREFESTDPVQEAVCSRWRWESVDWAQSAPAGIVWVTAAEVCRMAGYERPNKAQSAMAGAAVRKMHEAGGSAPGAHRKVVRGVRYLAVPETRGTV